MDKTLFLHTVATETAKVYTESNKPEYLMTGIEGFVKDFSSKYLEAYKIAEDLYNNQSIK